MLGRKQGNTHFQEDRISRRIRAVEHHGVRPAKSRQDGVGQRPDEQCPHCLWQHEIEDAAAGTKMKKSKTAKMKKSTTGSSKDASTQGAGAAGAAQKKATLLRPAAP